MNRILSIFPLLVLAVQYGTGCGAADDKARELKPLGDKTLVAWVCLADTKQRAGSVLTIIDKQERFDAIVFAEKEPGKWMAGSDFFKRTDKNQAARSTEKAGPKDLIQMAVVYKGKNVIVYRNGRKYCEHDIAAPQTFGKDALVLLGLRYIGEMGEIGFLKGSIEDARIYDVALGAGQIASLVPDKPSDPKPLAWWTFEKDRAGDTANTFCAQELVGNARVADGKLHLDGKSYLWAARNKKLLTTDVDDDFDKSVQTIFYKARSKRTGNMWDVWLYHNDKTYYLYYLAKGGRRWNNISMASSPDGVHWTEIERVLEKRKSVKWMGTGSTWKSPNHEKDGKFQINFSEWEGPRQNIHFAESMDLVHWTRLKGEEYLFVQDERWYKPRGRWDCIWTIARPGGGLYGYWTATPKPETGGRFGFGETIDGVHWRALPPPKVDYRGGEVGAIEKIGGKYYMMFGHFPIMTTLIADNPRGPFRRARKNFHLLSGHTYFSRFFHSPSGLLACHHAIAHNGQVSFSPLKSTLLDKEGTLRLGWWKGNEKMKHEPVKVEPAGSGKGAIAMLGNTFDTKTGIILEGTLVLPANNEEPRRGLYIECGKDRGCAILINSAGLAELGPMGADASGFKPEKKVNREIVFGKPARFRLLLKNSLMEFYLDDILIECFSLPHTSTGRVGLIRGGKDGSIQDLKAWR